MNTQGNTYTLLYASVMVIIVAAGLSFAAIKLQPYQEQNIIIEKKQNILASVHLGTDADSKPNKKVYIDQIFSQYITASFVVNFQGERVEGDAFTVDIIKERNKPIEQRLLPVYVATLDDGQKRYILPLYGKGLWGPIWGYIALKEDFNTVDGVVFDHKSETPGLGAEIKTLPFQNQFIGKKIFNEQQQLSSVRVVKNQSTTNNPNAVDAISGGTITSTGVDAMLLEYLKGYERFFQTQKQVNYEQ
ncbi:MAG TPA: NADH:ubiquinone reductase (Na(+)-transporting) subunit C [Salinivirgaceae bacterium]|nr:NADH:ubiquinone reductase (Na(+)-transporting) subunit C [Salinivirgaceae bacterium]